MIYCKLTINVSPFKKIKTGLLLKVFGDDYAHFNVPNQFHKMTKECQKTLLIYAMNDVLIAIQDYYSIVDQTFELTKRGDWHLHACIQTLYGLDAETLKRVRVLSAEYGSDFYNPAIDFKELTNGHLQWIQYINKDAGAPALPKEEQPSPQGRNIFYEEYKKKHINEL